MSNTILIYECAGRGETHIGYDGEIRKDLAGFQYAWPYADNWFGIILNDSASITKWNSPWRPINQNNTAAMFGYHPAGVNTLFGDGRVHFLAETTDPDVVRALASREGGEAVSPP